MQLSTPRITVGLPVYKGADLIAKALDCLQRQTFGNFEAIISVDGNDDRNGCRLPPVPDRSAIPHGRASRAAGLGWQFQLASAAGSKEFFCYRQHDDTTAPEFFEVLLQAADKEPNAAAIYCDCQFSGVSITLKSPPQSKANPWIGWFSISNAYRQRR